MDLSVVIVSWNVRDRLRECLRSIVDTTRRSELRFGVSVVDNKSFDGSADMVMKEFPNVQLIANEENIGFARANNQAIRRSAQNSDFFLLLNPDMRVLPGTLQGIVQFMREPRNARVGIVGCHLVDERGSTISHVRRFPQLSDQLAIMTKLPHVLPHITDRYLVRGFNYAKEARVDSIRGSFFCIRRSLIEQIGFLDERFFIWFEEVDYCKRAREAGWEVAYTPTVRCIDYVGQSFRQMQTYRKQCMFIESMLKYFAKHHRPWKGAVLASVRPFALGAARLRDAIYG